MEDAVGDAVEERDEDSTVAPTSDEILSDLRELSIRCRTLLHQLSANDDPHNTDGSEARELTASFNIWAMNMGVFREGQQSLTSRLKTAPETKKISLGTDSDEGSSASESDDSSDRSSTSSHKPIQKSEDEEAPSPPRFTTWDSVRNTITSLRQLSLTVRRAGSQHRQERIQRFKNLGRNREVCQLFERCARQKVNYLFPDASEVLRARMAESIARRRARFLYLERHQKKTSTLNEPAPAPKHGESIGQGEGSVMLEIKPAKTQIVNLQQKDTRPQQSAIMSNTEVTKLDPRRLNPIQNKVKRAESVSSVKISISTFPPSPKLDPGGMSFTCPYCFLVCPAKEASGQIQWMNHLIHDFEPFFCVFDDCPSPFTCADTYTGWLAHMRDTHTQPKWHCWHCETILSSSSPFSTPGELEAHLEKHHGDDVVESLRPTLVKHSLIRDQHALRDCPFCGGFPEEIEKAYLDKDSEQIYEALEKHIRDHLVSVALILAPVEMGDSGGERDDAKSDAQRGNDSERDLDGVDGTNESECQNSSCDCKMSKSSELDWPRSPGHETWELEDQQAISDITQRWQYILDEKMSGEETDKTLQSFAKVFALNMTSFHPPSPATELQNSNDKDQVALEAILDNFQEQRDKDNQCLQELYQTDPREDKRRIEQANGDLLDNNHHWTLYSSDFQRWRHDPENQMLWITGGPGTGKTAFLCKIIDELEKESDISCLSYFFCRTTTSRSNTAKAVLRGLIYLLVVKQPSLVSHVRRAYDNGGRYPFDNYNATAVLSEILTSMLNDASLDGAVLVVDALHKCKANRRELLDSITGSPTNIKWIVSSRDWLEIDEQLHNVRGKRSLCLNLSQELNLTDLHEYGPRTYVQYKVDLLTEQKDYDEKTKYEVEQYLAQNAAGNFSWIDAVYQELKDADTADILEIVHNMYTKWLDKCLKGLGRGGCRCVLSTIVAAYRSLHLRELGYLSGLKSDALEPEPTNLILVAINLCSPFLFIRDDIVSIHQSAKRFLSSSTSLFPNGMAEQHHQIFSRSLKYLSGTLRRDIFSLGEPGFPIDRVSLPYPNSIVSIEYSCVSWVYHLDRSDPSEVARDLEDGGIVHEFMQKKYLYWLESLSLQLKMEEGLAAIAKLRILTLSTTSRHGNLLRELEQFIRSCHSVVEVAPLQVYVLALVLSPTDSLLRRVFEKDFPDWAVLKLSAATGPVDWALSMAFSMDGRQLAWGSCKGVIEIWDIKTGHRLQLLKRNDKVIMSIAFSADGRQLASGSVGSIEIWDTTTGTHLRTIMHKGAHVVSLAFSTDDQRLASGAKDKTIKVWNATTGAYIKTVETGTIPARISFDPKNYTHLSVNDEIINLDLSLYVNGDEPTKAESSDAHSNYSLSKDRKWIMKDGKNILGLPKDYYVTTSAIMESTVAIGTRRGHILVIEFS